MRKFIRVDDNTWECHGEDWSYRHDHFYNILVISKSSKFSPHRKFVVELSGTNDNGYHYSTVVNSFDSRERAQNFAERLANLLNEQED